MRAKATLSVDGWSDFDPPLPRAACESGKKRYSRSVVEIRRAIHRVEKGISIDGNGDMGVGTDGEVYPVGGDGLACDSIGNIFDVLGD